MPNSLLSKLGRIVVFAIVTTLAIPAVGAAADATSEAVVRRWIAQMHDIDTDLRAAKWKAAQRSVTVLLREMRERIEGGPASGSLLAQASLYRALAEAGEGKERPAAWDFAIAQALYPDYAKVDLTPFGDAGKLLDTHRLGPPTQDDSGEAPQPKSDSRDVSPPRRKKWSRPTFPFAKMKARVPGVVVVQIIIDRDGLPRNPKPVVAADPVLAFAAMDELRNWTFHPATLAGKPVLVYYSLTVNYKLASCSTPKG